MAKGKLKVIDKAEEFEKNGELQKMPIAETRECLKDAYVYINKFKTMAQCKKCGAWKDKETKFYYDPRPGMVTMHSSICRECLRKVAHRVDKNGQEHEPTRESVMEALRLWDRPFLDVVWNASVQESENLVAGRTKTSVFTSYAKNIQMRNYVGMTYLDSDFFKAGEATPTFYADEKEQEYDYVIGKMADDDVSEFEKNKEDVKKLIGYLPFEKESATDQIDLYAQLIGMIDAGGDQNDDMMRNQSCISICRGFLQAGKIDDTITTLMADISNIAQNAASIKSLQQSKKDIMGYITSLAAESCISLKNNKGSNRKGENSWTGKIKKIKDLNLREGEVNGFDINTCKGMQQVADISIASIIKQLKLDESEYSEMLAEQTLTIDKLNKEIDMTREACRILLRENIELKDCISESNIDVNFEYVDIENLIFDIDKNESGDI